MFLPSSCCSLACFYEIHLKIPCIYYLFSLRQFQTVETIPIFESRDDGADQDLETAEPQEIKIKVCVMFYNIESC